MDLVQNEYPLGGGEGSVIYYSFRIGSELIPVAQSRSIKFSELQKIWVDELKFLDDFNTFKDIREILSDCEDVRMSKYIVKELLDGLIDD